MPVNRIPANAAIRIFTATRRGLNATFLFVQRMVSVRKRPSVASAKTNCLTRPSRSPRKSSRVRQQTMSVTGWES